MLALAVIAVAIGSPLLYRQLTGTGWEHKLPAWWLADIEMRFATGKRLEAASMGVLFGRNKRFSAAEYDRACINAFGRLESASKQSPPVLQPPPLPTLAAEAASKGLVDRARAAAVVERLSTPGPSMRPAATIRPGDATGLKVRAQFIPSEWVLKGTVTVNPGKPDSIGRGTFASGARSGNSSFDWGMSPWPKNVPAEAAWEFELLAPVGESATKEPRPLVTVRTWRFTHTFTVE